MTEFLLPTKLCHPQFRSGFIARPRLIEQLNRGLDGKLTLVSAPAGFGKTTLLAEWIGRRNDETAERPGGRTEEDVHTLPATLSAMTWLSLDEHDNDLTRFLTYLATAMQSATATVGRLALPRLQSSPPAQAEAILTLLINDLSRLDGKLGLILDDYHLIDNPAIHTALAFLLEHAPQQLHLVIAGRSDPPLSLSRWRVRGELNEIRAVDLRFTAAETAEFLRQALDRPLPEATMELLAQRTEGWPAGLQLAALSLRGLDASAAARFIAQFGGDHGYVFTYLIEEVLQRQPAFVQQFLLQTTLLERLTAPLCDAVTEISGWKSWGDVSFQLPDAGSRSQAILEYLATNNLFLIPLDQSGQWFRYHTLFAQALQARLQETQPDLVPELQRRAGRWCAANGFTAEAIRHTLAARDTGAAADLLEAAADRLLRKGHLHLLLSWFTALPEEMILDRLSLCLSHAWLLLLHDRWAEASRRVHLAGRRLATLSGDDPQTLQHHGRWAAIQGAMAAHRQEAANAISWMESALENLPPDDAYWRQVTMIGLGLAQLAEGQARSAITTFHQAALVCEQLDELYLAFAAWWHQVEACWAQGRLREAAECLRRLEILAERDEGNRLALPANAAIGWGMLAYERNDLAQAERLLTRALSQIWPGGQPRIALQAYLTLARLAQAQGDSAQMRRHMDTATQLVSRFNLVPERRILAATAARLLLVEGQRFEAHWQLESQGINSESPPDYHHEMGLLSLARLCLVEGHTDEAWKILSRLSHPAELAGRDGTLLEVSLLQALALAQRHQPDRALACLNRALALAEPEQFARIFINEGQPLAYLLAQVTPRSPYVAHLLAQMDASPATTVLLDPLTGRELEILSLVAQGATNQAIADRLVIGLGTVKGHMNHILGKLDVCNRTEAVARARELDIL